MPEFVMTPAGFASRKPTPDKLAELDRQAKQRREANRSQC
jgi:hypothetical protein